MRATQIKSELIRGTVKKLKLVRIMTATARFSVSRLNLSATISVNSWGGIAASTVVACRARVGSLRILPRNRTISGDSANLISSGGPRLTALPYVGETADDLSAIPRIKIMRPETV